MASCNNITKKSFWSYAYGFRSEIQMHFEQSVYIAFATDLWTDNCRRKSYFSLTCHYIFEHVWHVIWTVWHVIIFLNMSLYCLTCHYILYLNSNVREFIQTLWMQLLFQTNAKFLASLHGFFIKFFFLWHDFLILSGKYILISTWCSHLTKTLRATSYIQAIAVMLKSACEVFCFYQTWF